MFCAATDGFFNISFSQNRTTCHPILCNSFVCIMSRLIFVSIFWIQYWAFFLYFNSLLNFFQFLPCQKSPSQKTTTLAELKTKSGFPGSFLTCNLYRRPSRHTWFRKINSTRVFLLLFRLFISEDSADDGVNESYRGDLIVVSKTLTRYQLLRAKGFCNSSYYFCINSITKSFIGFCRWIR